MRRLQITLVILVGLLIMGVTACSTPDNANSTDSLLTVERGDLSIVVTGSGNFVTQREVILSLETAGKIADISCKEGDQVESGAILVKLETSALELALAQAQSAEVQAEVAQFEAYLAQIQAQDGQVQAKINLVQVESDLFQAEAGLLQAETAQAQGEAGQAQAQIALDAAEDDLDDAEDLLDRLLKYYSKSNSKVKDAQSWFDAAELQVKAAQAQLEAAQIQLRATQVQLEAAQVQLEATQRQAAATDLQFEIAAAKTEAADLQHKLAQANFEVSKLALAEAQKQLNEATITAPFDGIVATVGVDEGDIVSAGTTIVHLVDPSRLELVVEVDEVDIFKVAQDQEVTVGMDSIPDEVFAGKVTSIYPVPTKVTGLVMYNVNIELVTTEDAGLRIGMRATADIVVEKKIDAIKVPSQAVKEDGQGGYVVNVLVDEKVEERSVTIGISNGMEIEIIDGLSEGETITS